MFKRVLDWLSRSRVEEAVKGARQQRDAQWARAARATFFEAVYPWDVGGTVCGPVIDTDAGYGVFLNPTFHTIRYDPDNDSAGSPDIWSVG